MSFVFSIPAPYPVAARQLLTLLQGDDIHVLTIGGEPLPDLMDDSVLFYRQDWSTRGIWLQYSGTEYDVRINTLASKEDYLLATDIAAAVAELCGTHISPGQQPGIPCINNFRQQYNAQWAEENKTLGLDLILYMVDKEEPVCLHGCFHDFHIGRRLMQQIAVNAPDANALYEELITRFRQLQFPGTDYFIPNIFEATDLNQLQWSYVVLAYDTATLLKKADFLMLAGPGDEFEEMAFNHVPAIANEYFTPVDEYQYFVSAIPPAAFNALMKKAAHYSAGKAGVPAENNPKKWWQFWK